MKGTQSLSRVTGRKFMRGTRGILSDSSPILLGNLGFDGKLKCLNAAWEKALGYSPRDLQGRPLRELLHQHGPTAALVDRLLSEDSFDAMEFGLRCRDGTCKWFLWHRRFDSEQQAMFIAGYDITEQKSREIVSILRSYGRSKGAGAAA